MPAGEHAIRAEIDRRVRERTAVLEDTAARLRADKERLESRVAELEAFSYSVAHDLRSPLRIVHGFGEMFLDEHADDLPDGGRTYIDRMLAAASGMSRIIDAFLSLGRLSRATMNPRDVDLATVARELVAELRGAEPQRKVTFVCEPELGAWGDEALLRVLLTNLLGNAWKFTGGKDLGGEARIELGAARRADKDTLYFVRDNGIGFETEAADRLFRPFERSESSGSFDGSGVGLATVSRVVGRHGGRVWAEGAIDAGATIYFTLPRDRGARNETPVAA